MALGAAVGAVATLGLVALPVPPALGFVVAGFFALLLVLRLLPLRVRRPVVFLLVFVVLAGLGGGLYYFQFVIKPKMVKGFIAAAFAPKPSTVSAEPAKMEKWAPQLPAIGTFAPCRASTSRRRWRGRHRDPVQIGPGRRAGAPLLQIDDSTEQADLKTGLAQLKNADLSLERQQKLIAGGNTAKARSTQAQAARDTAAATVERTRRDHRAEDDRGAVRRPARHPQGRRRPVRRAGTSLVTLQQLDPIYVDFPLPEQALAHAGGRSAVDDDGRRLPRQDVQRQDRDDRRARQPGHAAACWCAPSSPIPITSCCRACSPMSRCCGRAARRGDRAAHGGQLLALRRQRLRA